MLICFWLRSPEFLGRITEQIGLEADSAAGSGLSSAAGYSGSKQVARTMGNKVGFESAQDAPAVSISQAILCLDRLSLLLSQGGVLPRPGRLQDV